MRSRRANRRAAEMHVERRTPSLSRSAHSLSATASQQSLHPYMVKQLVASAVRWLHGSARKARYFALHLRAFNFQLSASNRVPEWCTTHFVAPCSARLDPSRSMLSGSAFQHTLTLLIDDCMCLLTTDYGLTQSNFPIPCRAQQRQASSSCTLCSGSVRYILRSQGSAAPFRSSSVLRNVHAC